MARPLYFSLLSRSLSFGCGSDIKVVIKPWDCACSCFGLGCLWVDLQPYSLSLLSCHALQSISTFPELLPPLMSVSPSPFGSYGPSFPSLPASSSLLLGHSHQRTNVLHNFTSLKRSFLNPVTTGYHLLYLLPL